MTFAVIEPGTFTMGSPVDDKDSDHDEWPQHNVSITRSFALGTTVVTQQQWQALMRTRPWLGQEAVKVGDDYPATFVSWSDAVSFCKKLSRKEKVSHRLPTEAEWEYACRAGTSSLFFCGDDPGVLAQYAWYRDNADAVGEGYAHAVARKPPNPWQLYDMLGNVWEWCQDYSDPEYYSTSPLENPTGPRRGRERIDRGGSWFLHAKYARCGHRSWHPPTLRNSTVGFRVVREL